MSAPSQPSSSSNNSSSLAGQQELPAGTNAFSPKTTLDFFQKLQQRKKKNPKRLKFHEVPDYINQRYFVYTFVYSLFYFIGGIVGYSKTKIIYCIIMGILVGLALFGVGTVHAIDYYRGVHLEVIYVSIPFLISLFIGVLMTCIYSLGSVFKFSLVIAIICFISVGFYGYAIVKDYSSGQTACENRFIQPQYEDVDLASLLAKDGKDQEKEPENPENPTSLRGGGRSLFLNRRKASS